MKVSRTRKPLPPITPAAAERFWSKVDKTGPCWIYTGATQSGYGVFTLEAEAYKAHRVAWVLSGRSDNPSLSLDHECHNKALARGECSPGVCRHRACCNPEHLTQKTDVANTLSGGSVSAINARKVACPEGHDLDEKRRCPACRNLRSKLWREANPGWSSERVPCSKCGLKYARRSIVNHESVCGTPTRSQRERAGTVLHEECGAWISRSNIARHRGSCRGAGQRLPRRSRASILTYFDEGKPDA